MMAWPFTVATTSALWPLWQPIVVSVPAVISAKPQPRIHCCIPFVLFCAIVCIVLILIFLVASRTNCRLRLMELLSSAQQVVVSHPRLPKRGRSRGQESQPAQGH